MISDSASSGSGGGNPYAAILRTPGALSFSMAAVVARLPISMLGLGTILMIRGLYGEYSLAGRVSAVLVIAQAIGSPQIARLVDRHGQRHVMLPMLTVTTLGLAGLIGSATAHADEWVLYAFAALTGATSGSYGSMVRARWTHAIGADQRALHTAYSLESALDEVVFIIGPALATTLATQVFDSAGLLVPLVAAVVGGLWFLSLRRTEPPIIVAAPGVRRRSAMASLGMIALAIIFIAMGTIFGATDLSTVAFAEEQGHENLAGYVLAVFALGSLISGLLYGVRHWLSALWKRFAVGIVALAAGVSLFFFVTTLPVLVAVMFVTGFAIAPTLINGNGLVQNLVRPEQLTEGLAWVGTSLGVGVSIGSWIAGARIDAAGAHAGFQVVMVAAAVAVVIVAAALPTLRRDAPRELLRDEPSAP